MTRKSSQVAPPFGQPDPVVLRLNDLHRRHDHLNAGGDEVALGLHYIFLLYIPKGMNRKPGW